VGALLLKDSVELLTLPALATTTPHEIISFVHIIIEDEPTADWVLSVTLEPLTLAWTAAGLVFLKISYAEPFPPVIVMAGSVRSRRTHYSN